MGLNTLINRVVIFALLLLFNLPILAATPIASYSFDESDWQQTAVVLDSVANHNGIVNGSVTRNDSTSTTTHPNTCSSAHFTGGAIDVSDLPVSTETGDKTSVSFWMYWDGKNNVMPIGWQTHDLWFISGHFGFNTGGGDIYGVSSSGLANGWHHIAAVFTNHQVTDNELYIDGVKQGLTHRRGTIRNQYAVVQSTFRMGEWLITNGSYRFSGHIDELRIYTGGLSQTEVSTDMNYIRSDSCPIDLPPPPPQPETLIASYTFNDNWSSAQALRDMVGTANGNVSGSVSRVLSPPSGNKPETCAAGQFSGGAIDIANLPVSTSYGDKTSVSFWMYWNGANSRMPLGWKIHDLWFASPHFGFNSGGGDIYGISSSGLANSWHHIAVVFTNNNVLDNKIYIDGVEKELTHRRGTIINSRAVVDSHLRLGGWWYNNGYRFQGQLDEVRIYKGEITLDTINANRTATSACNAPSILWHMDEAVWGSLANDVIDSSSFDHHGTAKNGTSTASNSPAISGKVGTCRYGQFDGIDDYITSADVYNVLKGTASMSFWLRTTQTGDNTAWRAPGISGIEQSGGADDIFWGWIDASGHIGIAVGNDNRTKSTTAVNDGLFHHIVLTRDADTGVYQIFIDGSLNKSGVTGKGIIGTSFSSIGRIEDTGGSPEYFKGDLDEVQLFKGILSLDDVQRLKAETHTCSITTQAASFNCIATATDPIAGSLYTKLVNEPFTFDIAALRDTTPVTLETNFDNTIDVELVDASTSDNCANYPALTPEIQQSLSFNGIDGIASTTAITLDKAYRNLKCRVTDNTSGSALVSCSSDAFAVRPDKFTVSSPINNSSSSGSPQAKAGSDFSITASTATENYDGSPTLDTNLITAHAGAIQTGILTGSFPTADPLTGNTTGTSFNYSEVGNFKIDPKGIIDKSYTTIDHSGDCVSDSSSNVVDVNGKYGCDIANIVSSDAIGRFTPDHLIISNATSGVFEQTCPTGGFSYNGQSFTYQTQPTLTVTAYNAASPAVITQNYTGDFLKLSATDFIISPPTMDTDQLGADGANNVSLDWVASAATLTDNANGSHTFTSGNDTYTYRREANSLIAPFTSNVNLDFTAITDSDGVQTQDLTYSLSSTGTQIRYGRLAIANAHGSELTPLNVPLSVEYFTGLNWAVNTADSCTSVTTTSNFNYTEHGIILVPNLLPATATHIFSDGVSALPFGIAGEDNTGYIDITGSLDNWLQFDWNGDGNDNNPMGRATFGVFKGNDKIIFRREVY